MIIGMDDFSGQGYLTCAIDWNFFKYEDIPGIFTYDWYLRGNEIEDDIGCVETALILSCNRRTPEQLGVIYRSRFDYKLKYVSMD